MDGHGEGTATMREVAARAGVGLATVSRAFSAPDKLSPTTLQRIRAASEDLNYTVNLHARALRRRQSGVVLVLLPDIGNPFFSQLLKGIEEAAREGGRAVLVGDTGRDPGLRARYAAQVRARSADALILLDGALPFADGSPAQLQLLRAPVVAVSERIARDGVPYVGIDNRAAARDVAAWLAGLGHRRVAHLRGPAGNVLTVERARGFAEGAAAHGLQCLGEVEGDFSLASGRDAAERILSWPVRPTAIFAASDEMAMGILHAAKARGLRVPQDLSVVGFDDIAFSQVMDPPLATVHQPRHAMGRAAMAVVAGWRAADGVPGRTVLLDHALIDRGSLGPPPPAA